MSDDDSVESRRQGRETRFRELARRLMRELEERERTAPKAAEPAAEEAPEEAEAEASPESDDDVDPNEQRRVRRELKDLLGTLLATGNKTRAELIRLIAKEVRFYLEAAELDAMLHDLVTNYSLEINASVHLKPLGDEPEAPKASASLKKKTDEG